MAIPIPSPLIEFILLGPLDDRRQLHDSPILGDVWVEFGKQPDKPLDLLIVPYRGYSAGTVATEIDDGLGSENNPENDEDPANIAVLQGLIVACLTFEEVMRVVAPKTKWWLNRRPQDHAQINQEKKGGQETGEPKTTAAAVQDMMGDREELKKSFKNVLDSARKWHLKEARQPTDKMPSPLDRLLTLTALLLWAGEYNPEEKPESSSPEKEPKPLKPVDEQVTDVLEKAGADLEQITQKFRNLEKKMWHNSLKLNPQEDEMKPHIWQVSLNRDALPALSKSIPAVKADAATYLFKVNCSDITWAIIDSGIDGNHPAFLDREGKKSRVKKSFDFKNFRRIVSISNRRDEIRKKNIEVLMEKENNDALMRPLKGVSAEEDKKRFDEAHEDLKRLSDDARRGGAIHWDLVQKYVEIKPGTPTDTSHGTHVAGILGASQEGAENFVKEKAREKAGAAGTGDEKSVEKIECPENKDIADGMCPDISLYDFRVLGPSIKDAEFAIIAALQFIRYLNSQDNFLAIHGANLSLSIPHDVRNFACGRTPICEECGKLVSSGVVVVAAAGNHGYKSFETKEGFYDSYAAFSITDPGNADSVITVGATHRFWAHTYGVSFFSSRGPTGDGRIKPDLVAPGERIRAPLPNGNYELGGFWGDLDGTSMAAPHVSGAAAMLMARYSELVGQPLRIKRILCESATDLGRERSFQGHGMLDVLRAFQSI
jgi:serine protease AprX